MAEPLLHLALATDWTAAEAAGEYRISTIGATLDEVGYIHAAHHHQLAGVADRYYRDVTADLVVLVIDPECLDVPVVDESAHGGDEEFPHIYGPIRTSAVVDVVPVRRGPDGRVDFGGLVAPGWTQRARRDARE